jgi:hypothetical protein
MATAATNTGNGKIRQSVRGKKSKFFKAEGVDELVSVCMTLAEELWVVKERLAAVEALNAKERLFSEKDLDRMAKSEKFRAAMDGESRAFIDRVFFVLREQAEELDADFKEYPLPDAP